MRYHGKDKQTQTELGWSCGENDRKPLDDPHYVLEAPGGKKGTEEDQGQTEGRLGQFHKTLAPCRAKRGPAVVNGEGLRQTTDIKRLKLKLKLKLYTDLFSQLSITVNK